MTLGREWGRVLVPKSIKSNLVYISTMNITLYEPHLGNKKYTLEYKAKAGEVIEGTFKLTNERGTVIELTEEEVFNLVDRGLKRLLGMKHGFVKRND